MCMSYHKQRGFVGEERLPQSTVSLVLCALWQEPGKLLLAAWLPATTHLLVSVLLAHGCHSMHLRMLLWPDPAFVCCSVYVRLSVCSALPLARTPIDGFVLSPAHALPAGVQQQQNQQYTMLPGFVLWHNTLHIMTVWCAGVGVRFRSMQVTRLCVCCGAVQDSANHDVCSHATFCVVCAVAVICCALLSWGCCAPCCGVQCCFAHALSQPVSPVC
jgi:hypothetical protein